MQRTSLTQYEAGQLHCGHCGEYVKPEKTHGGSSPTDGRRYHDECGSACKMRARATVDKSERVGNSRPRA